VPGLLLTASVAPIVSTTQIGCAVAVERRSDPDSFRTYGEQKRLAPAVVPRLVPSESLNRHDDLIFCTCFAGQPTVWVESSSVRFGYPHSGGAGAL
jgi:hypothetical protein